VRIVFWNWNFFSVHDPQQKKRTQKATISKKMVGKIHKGPRGGQFIMRKGKKRYVAGKTASALKKSSAAPAAAAASTAPLKKNAKKLLSLAKDLHARDVCEAKAQVKINKALAEGKMPAVRKALKQRDACQEKLNKKLKA
jgi:hypothetical protein